MKKNIFLIVLTVLIATACSTTTKTTGNTALKEGAGVSFEYTAMTRGAYKKVIVKQDSVITIKDRAMKEVSTKKLSSANWNELVTLLKNVDKAGLQTLTPPSTKHQFDGALAAHLQIIDNGTTYQTSTFDHGTPPAQIKELTDKIVALSDLKEK